MTSRLHANMNHASRQAVHLTMETKIPPTLKHEKMMEGAEVVQVIVLHLDLFTCGTCGKQSTDILEHIVHKSHHKVSELYTCELCKLVVSSSQGLFNHYSDGHSLSSLILSGQTQEHKDGSPQEPPDLTTHHTLTEHPSVQQGPVLQTPTQHLAWDMLQPSVHKDESSGDQMETSLLYGVSDLMKEEIRDSMAGGVESVHVPSVASKTVSRSLLKAAKRTMLNTARRDVTCAKVQQTSGPVTPVKSARSQRPPILRGSPARASAVKYKPKKVETTEGVVSAISHTDNTLPGTEGNIHYLLSSMKEDLTLHREQCLHCDFSSADKDELSTHMRTKHKEVLEFQERLEIVTEEKSPCKKDLELSVVTSTHEKRPRKSRHRKVERQDLPGVYPCNQCSKSFKRLRYLRKHARVHKNTEQFVCEDCGKIFKCRGYLRIHMKTHENNEKLFKCNQCEFTSSINAAIHAHRQIHSQGSVLCDICGYAYTDKATLAKHKRVHDPSRPFACNFPGCRWRFKSEIMANAHIKAHTTEGKFCCVYCGYVFRHKHHLQRHESNIHGVKPDKSRPYNLKSTITSAYDNLSTDETKNSVNIIIGTDLTGEQLQLDKTNIEQHYLIIEPDDQSEHLSYETTDISGFNPAFTLIHSEEIHTND